MNINKIVNDNLDQKQDEQIALHDLEQKFDEKTTNILVYAGPCDLCKSGRTFYRDQENKILCGGGHAGRGGLTEPQAREDLLLLYVTRWAQRPGGLQGELDIVDSRVPYAFILRGESQLEDLNVLNPVIRWPTKLLVDLLHYHRSNGLHKEVVYKEAETHFLLDIDGMYPLAAVLRKWCGFTYRTNKWFLPTGVSIPSDKQKFVLLLPKRAILSSHEETANREIEMARIDGFVKQWAVANSGQNEGV